MKRLVVGSLALVALALSSTARAHVIEVGSNAFPSHEAFIQHITAHDELSPVAPVVEHVVMAAASAPAVHELAAVTVGRASAPDTHRYPLAEPNVSPSPQVGDGSPSYQLCSNVERGGSSYQLAHLVDDPAESRRPDGLRQPNVQLVSHGPDSLHLFAWNHRPRTL